MSTPLWTPSDRYIDSSNLSAFIDFIRKEEIDTSNTVRSVSECRQAGETYPGKVAYESLYEWSLAYPKEFWQTLVVFANFLFAPESPQSFEHKGLTRIHPPSEQGPRWFSNGTLNFAENLLRFRDDRTALLSYNERGLLKKLSYAELYVEVARLQSALKAEGIGIGDRVVGFMPNVVETVIAMLATTSLGAIWSSCSPDFGRKGVLDRFGQIQPKILFATDGYLYKGKTIDIFTRCQDIVAELEELERIVIVSYLNDHPNLQNLPKAIHYSDFIAQKDSTTESTAMSFAYLPFNHPLYIMYSSGTTGLPKCMVHGAGGTLIQHLKELILHCDLKREDCIFYFTTCGWMMWNWLVSSLSIGASLVLYDGSPFEPRADTLWTMAETAGLTVFGTSAKYLALLEKKRVKPQQTHKLSKLRLICSTGSPLAPEGFDYVYRDIKKDVQLASISGGTDIISCFALANPIAPVWRGELQCRGLGMKVEIFNHQGKSVHDEPGELVCSLPFPSMPVFFWNDPNGTKYCDAYFSTYDAVWRHGDWVKLTRNNGLIIYGRSDATLNPGGVRIGTAEIYNVVEQFEEVLESLVVGQEWDNDIRILLFLRMVDGVALSNECKEKIQQRIRSNCSPYHVPKKIIPVADIPRTISGKISELAVKNIIHKKPVKNIDALANPEALDYYKDLDVLRKS